MTEKNDDNGTKQYVIERILCKSCWFSLSLKTWLVEAIKFTRNLVLAHHYLCSSVRFERLLGKQQMNGETITI